MARPIKSGLDYFPLDVDFFEDDKTELISAEFGSKGEIVMLRLLSLIYKNGYFYEWNEEKALLLAKRLGNGFTGELVSRIVTRVLERGFLNEDVFKRFGILTSLSIQENYLTAVSRRVKVEMIQEYCLICHTNFDNVVIYSINVDRNSEKVDGNTQSKVKESKVKKSRVYIQLFDHYLTFDNLIRHRSINDAMKKAIDKAFNLLNLTVEEAMDVIERHSKIVELTQHDGQFAVKARPLYELFGQKAYEADHLICAEYLDDGSKYLNYLVNGKRNGDGKASGKADASSGKSSDKRNAMTYGKERTYTEDELEDMLINKQKKGAVSADECET